jgi:hypothetical protein
MNQIDRAFIVFNNNNPQILEMIVRYVRQLKAKGHKVFGMKAIFERIRWDYAVGTEQSESDKGFKISNNYTSRYARMIESQHPDLKGFFRTNQIDPTSMYSE